MKKPSSAECEICGTGIGTRPGWPDPYVFNGKWMCSSCYHRAVSERKFRT